MAENFCKYYKLVRQVSYDNGQSWSNTSVTKKGDLYESDSEDCGGAGGGGEYCPTDATLYRWVRLDPSEEGNYICSGSTKYYKMIKEESNDGGYNWEISVPYQYTRGDVWETYSEDCGYVPPLGTKLKLYRGDNLSYSADCDSTSAVTSAETHQIYDYTSFTRVEVGECINTIGAKSFFGLSGLTSVSFPSALSTIESDAFESCKLISNIEIPNSVKYIGSGAFIYCDGLTSVDIPNGVTNIGMAIGIESDPDGYNWGTFNGCRSLTSVTIPQTVTALNENSTNQFADCSSLIRITVDGSNSAYCDIDGVLFNKSQTNLIAYPNMKSTTYTIPNTVRTINRDAFSSCSNLTSVTIPDSVTTIGKDSFDWCSNIAQFIIPSSVTSIGNRAFHGCRTARSISIPSTLSTIGDAAFADCGGLTSFEIPTSLTHISNMCFSYCTSLTSVTIPSNITSIGYNAFYECSGLTSITVNATTPPTLGSSAFYGSSCPIYVPAASVSTYQSASGWSTYASRIQAIP